MLKNEAVIRFLTQREPEMLSEFTKIVALEALDK
jgi:hypothetical protein